MKDSAILLLLILCYCKSTIAPNVPIIPVKNVECNLFFEYVKENWEKQESGFWGFKGDSITANLARIKFNKSSKKCLIGLSRKQMLDLFGEPSLAYVSNDSLERIEYYFNENCKKPKEGCKRLKIHIDPRADTILTVLPIIKEWVDY